MKVTEPRAICSTFKDYFKKEQQRKKQNPKKKPVEQSDKKKDSNFIGWA
jgi:hypothetical protein